MRHALHPFGASALESLRLAGHALQQSVVSAAFSIVAVGMVVLLGAAWGCKDLQLAGASSCLGESCMVAFAVCFRPGNGFLSVTNATLCYGSL